MLYCKGEISDKFLQQKSQIIFMVILHTNENSDAIFDLKQL